MAPDPISSEKLVRFGVFEVNRQTGEARKHGIRIRLQGQPIQILKMLLERPGEVVTREEMRQRLWPGGTFVEFEHSLNSAVKKLRQALGDSADRPRYVETLPRVGYRFIAPVEAVRAESAEHQPSRRSEEGNLAEAPLSAVSVPGAASRPMSQTKRLWLTGTLLLLFVSAVSLGWHFLRPRHRSAGQRIVLAVLPFENLTGDASQDYFSDGLTEEMIAQLARLDPQHLGVIARTSVMHYKHSQDSLQQIGRELGVQYVLEGSFRRDAGRVRISAQLLQVQDQTHLLSRQYDRELSNLLMLQGEIAREVATEIKLTMSDQKRPDTALQAPLTANGYAAYDFYLRGRYFWNKRTPDGFKQAADYFQQAIAIDPNYARAYAGLADTFGLMSTWFLVPQNEFMPKARAAALKALQIDETLAEAHTSLALVAENYDYDWQTAEKEFRRGIQLYPSYATAHQWYAECLSFEGRFDEALAESDRARQLDPLSVIIAIDHGAILYYSRQYDRAIQQLRVALDMDPKSVRAAALMMFSYVQENRFADALADIQNWRRLDDGPWTWAAEAYVYGRWGRQAQARHALTKFEQLIRHRQSDPTPWMLLTYVGMDRKDEAIALLQKSYAERSNAVAALKVEPNYDPLRSDPRFADLLRRVGLPP